MNTNETKHNIRASDYNTLREAIATAIGISAQERDVVMLHVHDFDFDDARAALAGWCSAQFCGGHEFVGTDLTSGRFAHVALAEVRS